MKILTGVVKSDKMKNSATVKVSYNWTHPKYKKTVRKSKQYVVANMLGAGVGDEVILTETRPLSKLKHFRISAIVKAVKLIK